MIQLSTDNNITGVTYSTSHYEHYEKHGDKNYFEEIVDSMILDGIEGMNDTFKSAISGLSRDKKRMAILSLLDKDRNLFKRIKALTDKNINKMDHIKDVILMLREYVKVRDALCHSDDWKDELKDVFLEYKPTRRRYEEGDVPTTYRDLMPDLFSYDKQTDKCFIGDAKYYQDPENSHFDKEMYVYNQLINNKYPMCVFIPSTTTRRIDVRKQGDFELIVFRISVKEAIEDVLKETRNIIDRIHELIKKNSNEDRLKGGNFITE
jgi:hypothetical protein